MILGWGHLTTHPLHLPGQCSGMIYGLAAPHLWINERRFECLKPDEFDLRVRPLEKQKGKDEAWLLRSCGAPALQSPKLLSMDSVYPSLSPGWRLRSAVQTLNVFPRNKYTRVIMWAFSWTTQEELEGAGSPVGEMVTVRYQLWGLNEIAAHQLIAWLVIAFKMKKVVVGSNLGIFVTKF